MLPALQFPIQKLQIINMDQIFSQTFLPVEHPPAERNVMIDSGMKRRRLFSPKDGQKSLREEHMNILVLGGTRFFGIPMVEKLVTDGHDVTVATRGNAVNPFRNKTKQIILDRSDYGSVRRAFECRGYEVIIDKIAYCSNDVKNLLENVSCRKYIQMSSCSVYRTEKTGIKEEAFDPAEHDLIWMNRSQDYAEGKRQAERAAYEYLNPKQCIFVRYPVVLGEHDYTDRLKFYTDHVRDGIPMYVDDLNCAMSFIHEREAGLFLAHLADQPVYGAFNGCSKGMITPAEIIRYSEQLTGRKAILDENGDPAPYNGSHADVSYNTERAEMTGFTFSDLNEWICDLLYELNR